MGTKYKYISSLLLFLFIIIQFIIAPNIQQGYIINCLDWISTGDIPYLDFDCPNTPLGLYILSILYNGTKNEIVLHIVFALFHIVNLGLLYFVMKLIHLQEQSIWKTLIIYPLILLGTGCYRFPLEAISTFFILLSIPGFMSHRKRNNIIAGILLSLATACTFQAVLLIPGLVLLILLPKKKKHLHISRCFTCICTIAVCLLLLLTGVNIYTGLPEWILQLQFNLEKPNFTSTIYQICCICVLLCLFINLPLWLSRKNYTIGLARNYTLASTITVFVMLIAVLLGSKTSILLLLSPIYLITNALLLEEQSKFAKAYKIVLFSTVLSACLMFILDIQQTAIQSEDDIHSHWNYLYHKDTNKKENEVMKDFEYFDWTQEYQ